MAKKTPPQAAAANEPVLLSGGNPQIGKGDVGHALDALIVAAVPDVAKAVRWNSPFYGVDGQGWFVSFHCFTKYVKVTFFKGSSLDPAPPEAGKDADARVLHVHENDLIDDALLTTWIEQAAALPGWNLS